MLASSSSAAAQALARTLTTSSAAAAAVPAVASKSSGVFGIFGTSRLDVPLNEALPTSVPPLRSTLIASAPKFESGALATGSKVVAVESAGPVSSVSLVFGAGSAFETSDATLGSSRVLQELAFKASTNRTTFRITRELEKIGAVAVASAGRTYVSLNISAPRLHAPEVVELLMDTALNAKLNYWEVQEAVAAAKAKLAKQLKDPQVAVADALHRAAFDGGLGVPLYPETSALDHVTKESLQAFLAGALKPSSTVLAAAGLGLDEFKALAGPLAAAAPTSSAAAVAAPPSSYVGGSLNLLSAPGSPLAYVGLAFESKGGLGDAKGAAAAAVAKALLDGPSSVLPHASKEGDVLAGASGFTSLYKDTGLVGLVASSAPGQVGAVVDAASKQLEGLAKGVAEPQLKAAKQLVVGTYKAQLGSAAGLAAAAAPHLLLAGKFSPAEFVAAVEGLGAADVAAYVSKALKSAPTFVTYGSLSTKLPRYEALAKRFA